MPTFAYAVVPDAQNKANFENIIQKLKDGKDINN